jgi:ABC-2 type transport system ATP-binding protein
MAAINVEHLTKTYKTRVKKEGFSASAKSLFVSQYQDIAAVRDVSFAVQQGEILAFIGPNGAGKSTTIKMLTGILHPTSGSMDVLGLNPACDRMKLSYRIGTVFGQKSQLWFHLPPMDSFRLLGSIYDMDRDRYKKRIEMLIDMFEIGPFASQPVRKLSLGQRVRCEIAASLLHGPEVIFLDEPTIGLDVVVKQRIRELIIQLNRDEGVTIFLTSHDAGDIEQLCRRAMVIDHGTVIMDESVKKLKYDYLNKKVVAVRYTEPTELPAIDGVSVIKAAANSAKLEVDTRSSNIGAIMQVIGNAGTVADITISDPPMEEIIAEIFRREGRGKAC